MNGDNHATATAPTVGAQRHRVRQPKIQKTSIAAPPGAGRLPDRRMRPAAKTRRAMCRVHGKGQVVPHLVDAAWDSLENTTGLARGPFEDEDYVAAIAALRYSDAFTPHSNTDEFTSPVGVAVPAGNRFRRPRRGHRVLLRSSALLAGLNIGVPLSSWTHDVQDVSHRRQRDPPRPIP